MADLELRIVAESSGFGALAADAERATVALQNMAAAARGANSAGNAVASEEAAKISALASVARNGLSGRATEIGNEMRSGIAKALTDNGFWNSTFNNLKARFGTFVKQLNKDLTQAMNAADRVDGAFYGRNPDGTSKKATHTDHMYGAAVGYGAFETINKAVRAAADRESAKFQMNAVGTLSPDQQQTLVDMAQQLSNKTGNITTAEGIRFLASQIRIYGGPEHVFKDEGHSAELTPRAIESFNNLFGQMSYAKTYEAASGHNEDAESIRHRFESAIRSGEIKGLGTDPETVAEWSNKLLRIQMATGVNPDQFLQAQQQAGVSFLTMDDDAIFGFAAMVQENRARAGTMLRTNFMNLVGGNNQQMRANEALRALGMFGDDANVNKLAEEGKIELNKAGQISYIKDMSILPGYYENAKNPYKWDAEELYPRIRRKIMEDTGEDIGDASKKPSERSTKELTDIIRNITAGIKNPQAANQVAESIIQYAQLQRRGENAKKALIDEKAAGDLFIRQLQDFSTQMTELGANLGQSILPQITGFLKWLNGLIQSTGAFLKDNPAASKAVGWGLEGLVGLGALSGLRLVGSMIKTPVAMLIKTVIWGLGFVKGLARGVSSATLAADMGNIMSTASLAKTEAQLATMVSNAGRLRSIFGLMNKIFGILAVLDLGYQASQTDTGQSMIRAWKADINALLHPDNKFAQVAASNAKENADNTIRRLWGGAPQNDAGWSPLESKWYHAMRSQAGHDYEWLKHIRPPSDASTVNRGPMAVKSYGRGAAASSPMPVVVTQMPKNDKPPQTTVHAPVNVTVNVAQAVAAPGAVGAAVGAAAANALSDQHH